MGDKRIFIAIDISAGQRRRVTDHIEYLRDLNSPVRVGWERQEKLHITLRFIGNTSARELTAISKQVRTTAEQFDAFDMTLGGTGVFPNPRKPNILWMGVSAGDINVKSIERSLARNLAAIGYDADRERFTPHITIGRVREPEKGAELAAAHLGREFEASPITITDLTIYESTLLRSGSEYRVLERVPLGSAAIS